MQNAKVGIIFHTTYVGDSIGDMNAQAGADVQEFTPSKDVWFDNASYKNVSGTANMTKQESDNFVKGLKTLQSLLTRVPQNLSAMLTSNKDFIPMFTALPKPKFSFGIIIFTCIIIMNNININ